VIGYLFFASSFPAGEQADLLRLLTHVLYYSLGKTHGVAGELTRAEPWAEAAQTGAYIYGLVLYFLTVLLGSILTGIIVNAFYMLREQVHACLSCSRAGAHALRAASPSLARQGAHMYTHAQARTEEHQQARVHTHERVPTHARARPQPSTYTRTDAHTRARSTCRW
jgi:hypothetical protein